MLPTSQLRPTGTFCSYSAETSADIKSEITPIQIEEARASGRLYIKDCDIEYLPQLPNGFAPIFPDTCYHLTHYWPAAADIPVASDNPVHYADAIRYNARTPLQGSLLPLTRLV